jgi:hypothetical protein
VDQSIQLPGSSVSPVPPPVQQEQEHGANPATGSEQSWDTIPGTPSPIPFFYEIPPSSTPPVQHSRWLTALDNLKDIGTKMEDFQTAMMARQDAMDKTLQTLVDLVQKQGKLPEDAAAKAEALANLEAEKKQKMLDLENELRTKYADAGMADHFTTLAPDVGIGRSADKVESPKAELIGILNPLPAHKDWTGQAVDTNGHWISFSKWLTHLEAVMAQRQSAGWKSACLDVAALTCLRGRALDWWHSLMPEQQKLLREDTSLKLWNILGKALHRNEQILKKEARDRKRLYGETLSEYAWKKFAMIQEAFGTNRDAADIISDIKDGLLRGRIPHAAVSLLPQVRR